MGAARRSSPCSVLRRVSLVLFDPSLHSTRQELSAVLRRPQMSLRAALVFSLRSRVFSLLAPRSSSVRHSLKRPPPNIPIPESHLDPSPLPDRLLKPTTEQPFKEPGLDEHDSMRRIRKAPLRDGEEDVGACGVVKSG